MAQSISGGEVRWTISADTEQFDQALQKAKDSANLLTAELSKLDSSKAGSGFQRSMQAESGKTSAALLDIGGSLKDIGFGAAQAGFGSLAATMAGMATKGLSLGSMLEQNKLSFKALTGSAEGSRTVLSSVADFAANNPFQMLDVSNVAREMVAMSVPAKDVSEHLNTIGNVAVASGGDLKGIGHVFSQVAAQGKLMTQDMYQLVNQGVAIMPALSRTTGKSMDQIRDDMSKGKITFDVFTKAMKNIVPEDMAKELREEMNNTIPRQLDRLKGSLSTFATDFVGINKKTGEKAGDGLAQGYTNILRELANSMRSPELLTAASNLGRALTPVLNTVAAIIPKIIQTLGKGMNYLATNSKLLLPIGIGIAGLFTSLGSSLPIIGPMLSNVSGGVFRLFGAFKTLWGINPLVAGLVTVLAVGFMSAMKNSESFRNSMGQLVGALGTLAAKLMPVFEILASTLVSVIANPAVITILEVVASAVANLASVIASFPVPVLTAIVTGIGMFALLSASPILGIATGIGVIVAALFQLDKATGVFSNFGNIVATGFNNFVGGVIGFVNSAIRSISGLPKAAFVTANNFMIGLINGLGSGYNSVINYVASIGRAMITTINAVLGIHSPSREMMKVGNFVTLGLAKGIDDNAGAVEKAMDSLATSMLEKAEKAIDNRKSFKLIDVNGVYKDWQRVSQLFTRGSKQYESAVQKMEQARLAVNQKIFSLQEQYNQSLDDTKKSVNGIANIFSKLEPKGSGLDSNMIIDNVNAQSQVIDDWAKDIEKLNNTGLDPRFIKELSELGIESANDIKMIASMSTAQIQTLNKAWLKKQEASQRTAVAKLATTRKETLQEIGKISSGIDGETIKVADLGGRLVSNISDGITGALPTIDSALGELGKHIANAQEEASKKTAAGKAGKAGAAGAGAGASVGADLAKSMAGAVKLEKPKALDKLKISAEDIGKNMLGIVGGVLGGGAVFAVVKSLAKRQKTLGNTGKIAVDTVEKLKSPIEKTRDLTKTLTGAGQEMTRGQQAMATMRSGIFNIILLAGAIAAMAGALRFANDQLPNDLGPLVPKMILIGTVTAAMSGLAYLGKSLNITPADFLSIGAAAVAIAAVAGSLWLTNAAIPDNFGPLIPKLVLMGVAIAAVAGLAFIVGNSTQVLVAIGAGLLAIVGISATIAVAAGAMWVANLAIPNDIDKFRDKLIAMGLAIGGFGILAGVVGALMATGIGAGILAAGLAAIIGIAGTMVLVALAIAEINNKVPENIADVKKKIDLISKTLAYIASSNMGNIISNTIQNLNIQPLKEVVKAYASIARDLMFISAIPIVPEAVIAKVTLIKKTVEYISKTSSDSPAGLMNQAVNNFINMFNTAFLGKVVSIYVDIARNLNLIQNIDLQPAAIVAKVILIQETIGYISKTKSDSPAGMIIQATNNFINSINVQILSQVVNTYLNIAQTLNQLQNIQLNTQAIVANVTFIQATINFVTQKGQAWYSALAQAIGAWANEQTTKSASEILRIYSNLGDILGRIADMNLDEKRASEVRNKINILNGIVSTVLSGSGDGGIFGKIKAFFTGGVDVASVDNAKNIIVKLSELANAINYMPGINDSYKEKIPAVKSVISGIMSINTGFGDIANKEWIVGMATSIAYKLGEFANAANTIKPVADLSKTLESVSGAITQVLNSVSNAIASQADVFFKGGQTLGNKVVEGVTSVFPQANQAGMNLQSNFWSGLQSKFQDEFYQGQAFIGNVINGINSRMGELNPLGAATQSNFWWGLEGKFNDEFWQGRALIGKVIEGVNSRQGELQQSGSFASSGFISGAGRNFSAVYEAGRRIAGQFIQGIKDRGHEHSPWKTTYQSGIFAGEGLMEGIEASHDGVLDSANSLVDDVVGIFNNANPHMEATMSSLYSNGSIGVSKTLPNEDYRTGGVVINQTNNNYTQYSLEQMNRDMAWQLRKI
nr:MAG TPA: tail tape measure [Bacteriophage sp.]